MMKLIHVYTGEDGEAWLEDLEIPMDEANRGMMSRLFALEGSDLFRESDFDGPLPKHNPARRQFVVPIVGSFEIEAGDGTTRLIEPGTVLLADDVTGRGHASREIAVPRQTLFLPVPGGLRRFHLATRGSGASHGNQRQKARQQMIVSRIDHTAVYVSGLERSIAWYEGALGLKHAYFGDTGNGVPGAFFDVGDTILAMLGTEDPTRNLAEQHFAFAVESADATYADLVARGYAPVGRRLTCRRGTSPVSATSTSSIRMACASSSWSARTSRSTRRRSIPRPWRPGECRLDSGRPPSGGTGDIAFEHGCIVARHRPGVGIDGSGLVAIRG